MTKLKVNINKPQPPLDIIHKYRDFGSLMQRYTKYYRTDGIRHMLYNDRRKLVYIVIIIVFILLMLFADDVSF